MKLLDRLFGNVPAIETAKSDVTAARGRLFATIEEIQSRLTPRNIAEEAWGEARTRSAAAVENAAEVIRQRPRAAAIGAAAIGLALAAGPMLRRAERRRREGDATSIPDHPFNARP